MPSFSESIFLFILALLVFGPKKLPVLARELGKWVGEFRRASNEFKMQMEEELRMSEHDDRQKRVAAMEAAAPKAPEIPEPEHPHLPSLVDTSNEMSVSSETGMSSETPTEEAIAPLPIATSGELNMMPPATGLPVRRNGPETVPGELQTVSSEAAPESMTHAG